MSDHTRDLKLLATFTFTLLLTLPSPALSQPQSEKFTLGAILALSGEGAGVGEACRHGMTLALEELTPELREKIEIVYEDDQMQPKNAVSAFNRLVNTKKLDAAMTFSSPTSKAVAPLAERRKIPLLAIASDPKVVEGNRFTFNLWVTPEEQVKLLLKEIKSRGYKKIARIVSIHDGPLSVTRAFDRLNKGAVEIVLDEEYPYESRDFRTFISKLQKRHDVDAIFVALFLGQPGLFAKQARNLGVNLPLFTVESFEDPNEVKLSEGALVGQWYVQADDPGDTFLTGYAERFPEATPYTAGNCHDVVSLIAKAVETKRTSGEQLQDFLFSLRDFKGAMGEYSATGDNRFSLPAAVKVVTEKGFEKLDDS